MPKYRPACIGSRPTRPQSPPPTPAPVQGDLPTGRQAPATRPATPTGTPPQAQICMQARSVRFCACSSLIPYALRFLNRVLSICLPYRSAPLKNPNKNRTNLRDVATFLRAPDVPTAPCHNMGPTTQRQAPHRHTDASFTRLGDRHAVQPLIHRVLGSGSDLGRERGCPPTVDLQAALIRIRINSEAVSTGFGRSNGVDRESIGSRPWRNC
jgi:hypothetical protein